jgi:hypothetical protein
MKSRIHVRKKEKKKSRTGVSNWDRWHARRAHEPLDCAELRLELDKQQAKTHTIFEILFFKILIFHLWHGIFFLVRGDWKNTCFWFRFCLFKLYTPNFFFLSWSSLSFLKVAHLVKTCLLWDVVFGRAKY